MAKVDAAVDGDFAASSAPSQIHGPVEARSLSSITSIASNPPTYPRNPTQKKLDPLVLYIVRVPGSKDVFLSPLKPPTKASVSAEAINSSLYYLHVASPDDDALLQEYAQEQEEEAKLCKEEGIEVRPELAHLNNVRRKPVGGAAGGGKAENAQPPFASPPALAQQQADSLPPYSQPGQPEPLNPTQQVPETAIPPSLPVRPQPENRVQFLEQSSENRATRSPRPPQQRPLPPVPNEELMLSPEADTSRKPHRWSALLNGQKLENWKEKYETLYTGRHSLDSRPPQFKAHSPSRQESPSRSPGQSPTRKPVHRPPPERPGFHITLIRRDPTHGIQWNVATMSTPRLDGSPIGIEISTPGYNRFLRQDPPISLESLGFNPTAEGHNRISLTDLNLAQAEHRPNTSKPRKFHRELRVSRPHHDETRQSIDMPRSSMDSANPGLSKLKSGYYTFTSPWNGTCTFATSVNGRSLKCKHMIPLPTDSLASHTPGMPENPAVTVAEIRFNTPFQAGHLHHQQRPSHISPFTLSQTPTFKENIPTDPNNPNPHSKRSSLALFLNPNSYNRPRSRSGTSMTSTSSHNASGLTRNPSTTSTSSGAEFDEDRLDFTLARERAGGGMRGKSAKLGKLIIEDEGIKMLDLVVASCMSVWWKGYYY